MSTLAVYNTRIPTCEQLVCEYYLYQWNQLNSTLQSLHKKVNYIKPEEVQLCCYFYPGGFLPAELCQSQSTISQGCIIHVFWKDIPPPLQE